MLPVVPRLPRRRLRRAALVLGAAAAAAALAAWAAPRLAGGPLGPLPGGRLAGPEAACPAPAEDGFAAARGVREVQVEVRPARPRSVTTWALVQGGALYVPADWLTPWKTWPQLALEDPRVRVRVEGRVHRCCATRVEDPARIRALRAATATKYDVDPEGRAARVQVWWFRIAPCAAGEPAAAPEEAAAAPPRGATGAEADGRP